MRMISISQFFSTLIFLLEETSLIANYHPNITFWINCLKNRQLILITIITKNQSQLSFIEVFVCFSESFDDSSHMRPLRSTSTAGGAGHDFDTSFDASDIAPNNNGRSGGSSVFDDDEDVVQVLQGGKSPLPPSEAQDVLDNQLR